MRIRAGSMMDRNEQESAWTRVSQRAHSMLEAIGDWTSGTSSYPRKCSLTLLQGSNERRVSVPEGDEGSLRSTSLKTKTFGDHLR